MKRLNKRKTRTKEIKARREKQMNEYVYGKEGEEIKTMENNGKAVEEEDRKMTGTEKIAYQKRKAEVVKEDSIDDMDEGNLEDRKTSRQQIHLQKKGRRGE